MVDDLYNSFRESSNQLGEDNDCAVIAIAAVTGVSYETSWEVMDELGRDPCGPTFTHITFKALERLGFRRSDDIRHQFSARTIRTLERELQRQGDSSRYLVQVVRKYGSSHVMGIVGGKAIDWASGSLCRVGRVWRIFRK